MKRFPNRRSIYAVSIQYSHRYIRLIYIMQSFLKKQYWVIIAELLLGSSDCFWVPFLNLNGLWIADGKFVRSYQIVPEFMHYCMWDCSGIYLFWIWSFIALVPESISFGISFLSVVFWSLIFSGICSFLELVLYYLCFLAFSSNDSVVFLFVCCIYKNSCFLWLSFKAKLFYMLVLDVLLKSV